LPHAERGADLRYERSRLTLSILILVEGDGGIVMLAEIAMRQALAHDRLRPEHAPRKKLAERYKASADTEPPVSRRARRLDASAVG
jgi:hypothetical protein